VAAEQVAPAARITTQIGPGCVPDAEAGAGEGREQFGHQMPGSGFRVAEASGKVPMRTALDRRPVAKAAEAVETKGAGRKPLADALAQAVRLDMRAWWQPTVEGFWQRLPKAGMLYAMLDAKVTAPAPLDSIKKAEAAQMVATAMQGGDWLPVPLREMAA
jgi:hypothetical protein